MQTIMRIDMNYRDQKMLEWLKNHDEIHLKYGDVAQRYDCSIRTVKRSFKTFKIAGHIDIKNCKRGGVIVYTKGA